ncbi:MAG: DUF2975 domain-containing protein [Gammaproteobacteria bacterium]|nr:DUF2975 domain-containing protein [Gammaproteobacteria bacterium]
MTSQESSDTMNTSSQLPAPKYTMQLKICFDLLYYFSVFFMFVGVGFILVVGLSIPEEISERHTDIQYLFNAKMLPAGETYPTASEVILAHGMLKLNNTSGYAAWFFANIETAFAGLITLLGLYNLRKLFANLSNHQTFEPSNVLYIKRLGYIVLSYCILKPVITYLCGLAILADIGRFHEQLQLSPLFSFPFEGLLMGAALLVLAQIINDATTMKQEQALTI